MTLTPGFWERERDRLRAVLLPRLEAMALSGVGLALQTVARIGMGFDVAPAQSRASVWARTWTDRLLEQLGTTTAGSVGEVIANWMESGGTRADLEQALLTVLDENAARAETIAVTEATRAFAQGAIEGYIEAGLPPVAFAPPAHPQCRCWPRPVRLPNGDWVIVWQTNRDELVCQRDVETPWGVVSGCGALDTVVISQGPYLGLKLAAARERANV